MEENSVLSGVSWKVKEACCCLYMAKQTASSVTMALST